MLTMRELRHLTKSTCVFFAKTAPRTIYYSRSTYHPMQRGSDLEGCAYGRAIKVIGGFAAIVDGLTEVLSLGSYCGQLQFTFLFDKSGAVGGKGNGFMECYEDGKPHCDKCKERNNGQ